MSTHLPEWRSGRNKSIPATTMSRGKTYADALKFENAGKTPGKTIGRTAVNRLQMQKVAAQTRDHGNYKSKRYTAPWDEA